MDRGSEEPDSESSGAADRRPSEPGGKAGSESPKGVSKSAGGRADSAQPQEEHDGASKAAATTNGINGVGA